MTKPDIEDAIETTVRKLAHVLGTSLDEAQHYYDVMDPIDQRLFVQIANLPDDPNEWD